MRLLLTVALLAVPAAALAQPADTLVVQGTRTLADNQQLVSYADLQLASASGQRELRHRVDGAIASLCDSSHFSISDPQGSLKCSNQAWTDVAPQLARLTPRFASR
ncbi:MULTISPECIES: UrcA family protein [Sphingomonas]|uniref:UrcA family protein n=1 Tax=Sphingomonas TaxID=13687 RepID=UPI000DEF6BF0|nr:MULTISPECIES: UrcA family protein [Sphingomonas]